MEKAGDLRFAVQLLFVAFVIEFAGVLVSSSLALLSDSLFIFAEFLFFVMVLYGIKSKRIGMVSAGLSLAVFLGCLAVMYLSVHRFVFGGEVRVFEMLVFASVGLVLNTYVMRNVRRRYILDTKESFFHVFRKSITSLLVVGGGLWIVFTGEMFVDYLFSFIIVLIVMFESIRLFRDSSLSVLGGKKSKTYLFRAIDNVK